MAPAFLLVAITNFLGLITASRQRVMERYRQLLAAPDPLIGPQALDYETAVLRQRISLTTRSIGMLTLSVMLIALVIFLTFVSLITPGIELANGMAVLFALAMLILIGACALFIHQLRISSRQLQRIGLSR